LTSTMFSNKFRILKILLALAALGSLFLYSYLESPRHSLIYEDCQENQAFCQEQTVEATVRRVLAVKTNECLLSGSSGLVPVIGEFAGLAPLDVIDVAGRYTPGEPLEALSVHKHRPGRWIKVYGSLPPVLLVGWLLWRASKR